MRRQRAWPTLEEESDGLVGRGHFLAPFLARLSSEGRQTSRGCVELVAVDNFWKPVWFTELDTVGFGECDYLS
jgi:hypothetical protein